MGIEHHESGQGMSEKITVIPADREHARFGIKNCIAIDKDASPADLMNIIREATANKAFDDNEATDEGGEDNFLVQFPGGKQESLDRDKLRSRLQELSGDYTE